MTDLLDMIYYILPFIFGLIAISLIPSKEKILNRQVTTFRVEFLVLVYIIALLILSLGFFIILPIFGGSSGITLINIFNGSFLTIVALGLMGLNYRNYSLISKSMNGESAFGTGTEERVEVQAAEVSESFGDEGQRIGQLEPKFQMVGCPNCSKAMKVNVSQLPVKISCPNCGIEGMIQ